MDKVRILHCADIHFDTPFKEFKGELAIKSKGEIREVFSNIIDLCIKEKVQILLIAGDVFDNLTVSRETLKYIESELLRIPSVYVFISPGNHDPYNEKSFYNLVNWPSNVYIFKGESEFVEISELKVRIYGVGFNNKYEQSGLLNMSAEQCKYINLMVIHGEVTSGKSHYNPITINDIGESNMDYVALGHTHEFSGILKSKDTYYAYPGCPQGRGFDELGDKGVILGDVSSSGNDLEFIPVCKRRYREEKVDISNTTDVNGIIFEIINSIEENDKQNNFYKIILTGEVNEDININTDLIKDRILKEFYFCKIKDETTVKINLDNIKNSVSIKGIYAQKLLEEIESCINEEEKEVLRLALKLGINSLTKEEVNLNDY